MAASSIPKRFIGQVIDDSKVEAGAAIATTKLADAANFILRGGSVAFTANQSMGNNKLTNVATPTAGSTDAARIIDVENAIAALNSLFDGKGSVRAASTANVTVSNPGTAVFDGVTLASGERLLLKNQTTQAENGIYVFTASGSALTRATDFDAWNEIPGAVVPVEEGTANADTLWLSTANSGGTLGTTAVTWFQIPTTASGLTSSNFVSNETPSGSVNGSNTTFTLANTPTAGSEDVWIEGVHLTGGGNDYSISGPTITMIVAPLTGEKIRVSYRK